MSSVSSAVGGIIQFASIRQGPYKSNVGAIYRASNGYISVMFLKHVDDAGKRVRHHRNVRGESGGDECITIQFRQRNLQNVSITDAIDLIGSNSVKRIQLNCKYISDGIITITHKAATTVEKKSLRMRRHAMSIPAPSGMRYRRPIDADIYRAAMYMMRMRIPIGRVRGAEDWLPVTH